MAKVSAIVTAYNVQEYIATAMQSVIDTCLDELELIVVDDGSNDATQNVIEFVMAANPSTTIIPVFFSSNSIGGVGTAANVGLDYASGDIILFVDGDDWVIPFNLKQAIQRLESCDADFLVCGCKEYWNDSGEFTRYPEGHLWHQIRSSSLGQEDQRELLLKMAPFPWRKIYRKSFLDAYDIRFPIGDFFYEDNPFHWETSVRAGKFEFFEPDTHVHRMARTGQTVTQMNVKPLKIFMHAKTIAAMLAKSGKAEEFRLPYLDWLLEHVLWCCRYVPQASLYRVFDLSRPFLDDFSLGEINEFMEIRGRKINEIRMILSIYQGDFIGFLREFRP